MFLNGTSGFETLRLLQIMDGLEHEINVRETID